MELSNETKKFLEGFTRIILYHVPTSTNADGLMVYKVRLLDEADYYIPIELARYVEAWKVSDNRMGLDYQNEHYPDRLEFKRYDPEAARLIKMPHLFRDAQAEAALLKYLTKPNTNSGSERFF
jgi:hypothetical protein